MAENNAQGWGAEMNAAEHIGTYDAFIKGAKWGTVAVVALVVLMAIFPSLRPVWDCRG